ncbi:MAG: cyclic nucleotide-binding domain-containing protein [Deltaproteobacteria bacterium]|jgi:CRP-like cAMP-binding protein|nr:cyclic nucleotide-binding domain-containing protein [Deltaproteobacteria bacterium]
MTDAQANYLINTAPEIKTSFIRTLKKIVHFSRLPEDLLLQLFKYSRFFVLEDGETLVKKGSFGQNIYILIQGRLEVFLTNESGLEEQVDVIYNPLRIFGEQCILGEPSNTSIKARGKGLLIGIDISALPDLLDGIENPINLLEDEIYRQNKDMYMIFADVLNNRINRLIKDQYKLVQKILILHQSKEYRFSWKQNILLSTIFNEFSQNQLSPNIEAHTILATTLAPYLSGNDKLNELLKCRPINTQHIYLELVRLDAMGELLSMSVLLTEIVQKLAANASNLDEYTSQLEFQSHNLPGIIPLSKYLDAVYNELMDSKILVKELSKEQFLEGFLSDIRPDPFSLETYLREGGWIMKQFNMAHLMYTICQICIIIEFELNNMIAGCISYLNNISSPRQNTQSSLIKDYEQNSLIVTDVIDLHHKTIGDKDKVIEKQPTAAGSEQTDVENLLADFGL